MYSRKTIVVALLTNKYAGNLEREATAFCTGIIGDCEVGEEQVDREIGRKFEEYVVQVADEHGCYRPTTCNSVDAEVMETFKEIDCEWNEAVFIFFEPNVPRELLVLVDERAKDFFENSLDWRGDKRNIKYNGLVVMEKDLKISSEVIYTI